MYCRICGSEENVTYYFSQRQALCPFCKADTPAKIGREEFDRRYWAGDEEPPCEGIRREFYDDYKASSYTYAQYAKETAGEPI